MKLIHFTISLISCLILQCDSTNDKVIPSQDLLHGVWRTQYNDSIKFIDSKSVYINSISYSYEFINDSLNLYGLCEDLYGSNVEHNKSISYEFDADLKELIIHDFSNIYDSIYGLQNYESSVFFKTDDDLVIPFEEWIQGNWTNQSGNSFLFTRPFIIADVNDFHLFVEFVNDGKFYIPSACSSVRYVFTKDSLKLQPTQFSNLNAYISYAYEIDTEEDLLMLINFDFFSAIKLDTVKFYKE